MRLTTLVSCGNDAAAAAAADNNNNPFTSSRLHVNDNYVPLSGETASPAPALMSAFKPPRQDVKRVADKTDYCRSPTGKRCIMKTGEKPIILPGTARRM